MPFSLRLLVARARVEGHEDVSARVPGSATRCTRRPLAATVVLAHTSPFAHPRRLRGRAPRQLAWAGAMRAASERPYLRYAAVKPMSPTRRDGR